jgi:hypothetical protein
VQLVGDWRRILPDKGKDIVIYFPRMALADGLGIGKGDLDTTCRQ